MASLSNAKVLGGVGGILALIPAIGVVGWILILVSLKEVSDVTQDRVILRDALVGALTAIISAVTIVVFLVSGPFTGFLDSAIGVSASYGPGGLVGAVATFAVFYVCAIISGIFLKRAYDKTAQRLRVGSFATAGLLYLVGALTSIVIVGFLIFLIAFIYQIIAYFSIQDQPPPIPYYGIPPPQPVVTPMPQLAQPPATPPNHTAPPQQTMPPLQPVPPQTMPPPQQSAPTFKFCFRCGTKLPYHAIFCSNCGTRQ
jgi:uncharacterized membrane protein